MTRGHVLLADYLRRYDLSPRDFALMMQDARRERDDILLPQKHAPERVVTRLLAGGSPRPWTVRSIALASAGEVPAESWEESE